MGLLAAIARSPQISASATDGMTGLQGLVMRAIKLGAKQRRGETTAVLDPAVTSERAHYRYISDNALGGVYPIIRRLGEGGFGEVFLCKHPDWGVEVAVKAPRPGRIDAAGMAALQVEADTWTRLGLHPNCVYCYHLHPVGNIPLLVVEYVPGGTLRDYLRTARTDVRIGLDLAIQLCQALEHAHANHFVHRDVKPENILVFGEIAKLTDFGIVNGGTPGYRAPEQADPLQTVDERVDLELSPNFGDGLKDQAAA
jgi:serine/threonine protein kinase